MEGYEIVQSFMESGYALKAGMIVLGMIVALVVRAGRDPAPAGSFDNEG